MIYAFAGCELDADRRELRRDGKPVEVEPKVLDLLLHMVRHRDRAVAKRELLDAVWPEATVVESALTRAMSLARRAIGDSRDANVIRTLRGVGYRFTPDVAEIEQPSARPTADPFVGREDALRALEEAWEAARAGAGACALLAGEAGIGKTRTAEELAARVRARGGRVLVARAYETESAPPYWMWVQLLRGHALAEGGEALGDRLGIDAPLLAPLVPGLEAVEPEEALPELADDAARFRLFDALASFLLGLGRDGPLLVLLDDLHWVDRSSLRALAIALRELGTSRVLVVGTYRDDEVAGEHPLLELLALAARQPGGLQLRLEGLGPADVTAYTRLRLGRTPSPALAKSLFERSAGNPLFVRQLVELVRERPADPAETNGGVSLSGTPLPPALRAVIGERVERLSEDCRELLAAAAVVGSDFDRPVLARVAGIEAGAVAARLDEALKRGLLSETGPGAYRFAHQLIQESLRLELGRARRAELHTAVADAIEGASPDPDAVATELAHHHFEAARAGGDAGPAFRWSRRAGDVAAHRLAHEEAASHYGRALEARALEQRGLDLEECELLLARAEALNRVGDLVAARRLFLRVADLARRLQESESLARASLGLGRALPVQLGEDDPEQIALVEESLSRVGEGDPRLRADLLARLAFLTYLGGDPERCLETAREAVRCARRADEPRALAPALMAEYAALERPGNLDDRRPRADAMVAVAERAHDADVLGIALNLRAQARLRHGDAAGARADIAAQHALGERTRHAMLMSHATTMRAGMALFEGRAGEAERLAHEALRLGERYDATTVRQAFGGLLLGIRIEQGRSAELEPVLRGLLERWPEMGTWHLTLGWMLSLTGRLDEARDHLRRAAADGFVGLGNDILWGVNVGMAALICGAVEDVEIAEDLYPRVEPYAGLVVTGPLGANGPYDWYLGRLARVLRRFDAAAEHLEAAIATADEMGTPLFGGRARCEYARVLVASGRARARERAQRLLAETLSALRACDLPALGAEAESLR